MEKSEKARKIIGLSTAAAVGLSATAIVLSQDAAAASKDHVKVVQSALRDGATVGKASQNTEGKVRLAGGRYDR
jgi:hypothetical protein